MFELPPLDCVDDLMSDSYDEGPCFPLDGYDEVSDALFGLVAILPEINIWDLLVSALDDSCHMFEGYAPPGPVRKVPRRQRWQPEGQEADITEAVTLFMHNASRYHLLTLDEERILVARKDAGDLQAADDLVTANLRLVVKIAHDFKGRGLALDDLVAEGSVGLIRGVHKYHLGRGAKVSSYVAWWIKQAMHRAVSNQSRLIRMPVQSAGKWFRIRRAEDALEDGGMSAPSNADVAARSGLSERTVENLRGSMATVVSLDDHPENSTVPYSNLVADMSQKDSQEKDMRERSLYEAVSLLSPREQVVVKARFGIDGESLSLPALGKIVGRTRERVRQIEREALGKLKMLLRDRL